MSSFSFVLKSKIDEDLAYSVQCVLYDVTAIKRYWGVEFGFFVYLVCFNAVSNRTDM